jgi:hypothetical protein
MKNMQLCNCISSLSQTLGLSLPGTGGLRKIRWTAGGKGKRGGTRVIYYHVVEQAQIRMILIYRKGIKDDLTPKEKMVLRKINAEWRHG